MMHERTFVVSALVCLLLAAAGCGGDDSEPAGSSSGGTGQAGSGGTETGGEPSGQAGSIATGGTSNGGASNGGASDGGTSNGGTSNGGTSNGGTSNGGQGGGSAEGGAAGAQAAVSTLTAEGSVAGRDFTLTCEAFQPRDFVDQSLWATADLVSVTCKDAAQNVGVYLTIKDRSVGTVTLNYTDYPTLGHIAVSENDAPVEEIAATDFGPCVASITISAYDEATQHLTGSFSFSWEAAIPNPGEVTGTFDFRGLPALEL